jgi:hypothetical protein
MKRAEKGTKEAFCLDFLIVFDLWRATFTLSPCEQQNALSSISCYLEGEHQNFLGQASREAEEKGGVTRECSLRLGSRVHPCAG